jgi:predicted ester cyclase
MSTHTYKELQNYPHQLYANWNASKMDDFYEMIDEHVIDHNAGETETGRVGVKKALDTVRSAFKDGGQYEVLDVIVDESRQIVTVFLKYGGFMEKDLFGVPPANKYVEWTEMRIARVKNFKTVDHWAVLSTNMLYQMGRVKPNDSDDVRESW